MEDKKLFALEGPDGIIGDSTNWHRFIVACSFPGVPDLPAYKKVRMAVLNRLESGEAVDGYQLVEVRVVKV